MNIFKKMNKENFDVTTDSTDNEKVLLELRHIRQTIIEYSKKDTLVRRFWFGVAGGFGTVVGATVLVSIVLFILSQFASVPILDQVVERIIEIIEKSK